MIFVFGSNLAGIHGAGAAKHALRHGAAIGIGVGRRGNSYAIPTKDQNIRSLPIHKIEKYVFDFLDFAKYHYPSPVTIAQKDDLEFQVTCIGCGLAGFSNAEIAPMFIGAPDNCYFDEKWRPYLGSKYRYWGTF